MGSLRRLKHLLNSQLKAAEENIDARIKSACLVGIRYLAEQTPVDTSKTLSNWRVVLDQSNEDIIPAHKQGQAGSTRWQSINITVANAKKILKSRKKGQRIFIVNNMPNLLRLNNGWSQQHPGGFVQAATMLIRHELGRKVDAASKRDLKG